MTIEVPGNQMILSAIHVGVNPEPAIVLSSRVFRGERLFL